jgi:hypothetical protein
MMKRKTEDRKQRLQDALPAVADILRGSLLHRMVRHRQGCPKCAAGGGHPVWVLAVGYPGGKIRQISLGREQVPGVRRRLANYRKLKAVLERICELNQQELRNEPGAEKKRG